MMMIFSTWGNKNSRLLNSAQQKEQLFNLKGQSWMDENKIASLCAARHTALEKQTKKCSSWALLEIFQTKCWEWFQLTCLSLFKEPSHLLIIESIWSCDGGHSCRFLILEVCACQSCAHDKNIRSIWSLGSYKSEFHLLQVSVSFQKDEVWPLMFDFHEANSREYSGKKISAFSSLKHLRAFISQTEISWYQWICRVKRCPV